MTRKVMKISEIISEGEQKPSEEWQARVILSGDCLSYGIWNVKSRELLFIDPKKEDLDTYLTLKNELSDFICLGVIDTHTHADHISAASQLAELLKVPLIMNSESPSKRVHLRVARPTFLPSRASPIELIPTPGHTPDGMCVVWGPFVFTGDTVLYGDVGRDDLPGGDPTAHYESLQHLVEVLLPDLLVCPGHDFQGGRISSWAAQLKTNSSLAQEKEAYVQESLAFDAPAPTLLKKSLSENFR